MLIELSRLKNNANKCKSCLWTYDKVSEQKVDRKSEILNAYENSERKVLFFRRGLIPIRESD